MIFVEWAKAGCCKVKLTFIGCSSSNRSAFYLYRATTAGLSSTPWYAHMQAFKDVWLMYDKVRTLLFGCVNLSTNQTIDQSLHVFIHITFFIIYGNIFKSMVRLP